MSTFTLAISCLTTSNLPWFMDLTFQVPMQYCSVQHQTLLLSPVPSTTGYCFCFDFIPSFFLELHYFVNFQIFKLVLEKAEEPEIKLPVSAGSLKKQESSRKMSISALLTMPKPLTLWITISCGKFRKRWKYQTTWPASWETYMQVRKQQVELDMEQQTGSK